MKNAIRREACAATALVWLLAGAGMASAQVCVNPAGGGCQLTIQAGVDVATAGQTVTVEAAVYSETVEIPPGKDGLVISAAGAVLDNPTVEDGISIQANDVTIRGLTMRNGNTGIIVGDNVLVHPTGTVLTGLTFNAIGQDCVLLQGADDTAITKSTFTACGAKGVAGNIGGDAAGTDGAVVTKNRFRICSDGCIEIFGDDAVVSGNKISQSEDSSGVFIHGAAARVEKNSLTAVSGGVLVIGDHPVVVKNKVSVYTSGSAFEVYCTASCAGALVDGNRAANGVDDAPAFAIASSASGMVVSRNSTRNAANEGFNVGGTGISVTGNTSTASGGDNDESGFEIDGDGHVITGNTATGNANDGFRVTGAGIQLTGNVATGNFGDGFEFNDDSTSLTGIVVNSNTASDNTGQGFSVLGDSGNPISVTLTGNSSTGNRVPFCDDTSDGDPTDGSGNSFTVAGAPACEVDHN